MKRKPLDNKRRREKSLKQLDALVGRRTQILGEVRFRGGLHVDGLIRGTVVADDRVARLSVSETGRIKGDVRVPEVILHGTVEGDVYATQSVVLATSARVKGTVYYREVKMHSGAMVTGGLVQMKAGSPAATLKTPLGTPPIPPEPASD